MNVEQRHTAGDPQIESDCRLLSSTLTIAIYCNYSASKLILILPSHLRPTTRECVHLVARGHFRSRDKDGGHTSRSAIGESPMLYANFMAGCFIEPQLLSMEVLHCRNRNCLPLCFL